MPQMTTQVTTQVALRLVSSCAAACCTGIEGASRARLPGRNAGSWQQRRGERHGCHNYLSADQLALPPAASAPWLLPSLQPSLPWPWPSWPPACGCGRCWGLPGCASPSGAAQTAQLCTVLMHQHTAPQTWTLVYHAMHLLIGTLWYCVCTCCARSSRGIIHSARDHTF